jgi:uncharacterized membrane protein
MTTYEWIVAGHVVGAVAWVGSGTFAQVLGQRVINRGDGEEIRQYFADVAALAPKWFIPVSLWTVVFGIAAAIDGPWKFSAPWINIGLTMFVISFLIGVIYLGPHSEKLAGIAESDGADSPAFAAKLKQFLTVARFELALLWLTVLVMVVKPG